MLHTGRRTRGLSWHSLRVNGAFGWRVVLVSVLLLSIFCLTASPSRAAIDGYVDTDVLLLRSDPGTGGDVLARMHGGEYVAIIDGPSNNGWYFIDYAGIQGWAHGGYLSVGVPLGGTGPLMRGLAAVSGQSGSPQMP